MEGKNDNQPAGNTDEIGFQHREPIGVIIMGKDDPRKLTEEQFRQSSELLFHGYTSTFVFSPDYNYTSEEYYTNNDGSQTLGEGFYTTNERESAENYSIVRQFKAETTPITIELLPYQAKILDLRDKADPSRNAPTLRPLFEKWVEHFRNYYFNNQDRENLPWNVTAMENEYWSFLMKYRKLPTIELRAMLGTAPCGDKEVGVLNYPTPPWMKRFANFMKQEDYDGIGYVEGGEGKNGKPHTSFVFFNLEKIGTFENWQKTKDIPKPSNSESQIPSTV